MKFRCKAQVAWCFHWETNESVCRRVRLYTHREGVLFKCLLCVFFSFSWMQICSRLSVAFLIFTTACVLQGHLCSVFMLEMNIHRFFFCLGICWHNPFDVSDSLRSVLQQHLECFHIFKLTRWTVFPWNVFLPYDLSACVGIIYLSKNWKYYANCLIYHMF